jgi:hypothetical protein
MSSIENAQLLAKRPYLTTSAVENNSVKVARDRKRAEGGKADGRKRWIDVKRMSPAFRQARTEASKVRGNCLSAELGLVQELLVK